MKYLITSLLILLLACNSVESSPGGNKDNGRLYLRTYMWTGMYGTSLDISWLYLSADGRIVRNPVHGVNPVVWEKELQDNAANTGRYTEKDGKLLVNWSSGKTESWKTYREKGKVTNINGGIVSEPTAVPANYRIGGKYVASTVLPNVANSQTLVFQKDGTFSLSSLGTVSSPQVTGYAQDGNKGTYDISGNTLTFHFADGSQKKSVICIWDNGGKKNLVINSRYYPQEK